MRSRSRMEEAEMNRATILKDSQGRFWRIGIRCPAGHDHNLPVDWTPPGMERSPENAGKPIWGFNGDLERPTLTPSILWRTGHYAGAMPLGECPICKRAQEREHETFCVVCHSFVRDGRIQFLPDCTHALAGQTVDLPEIEEAPK